MSDAEFIQRLQESVRQRPFKPFDLEWPGGERLRLDDPDALAFRGSVAVYIDRQGNCTLLDAIGPRRLNAPRFAAWRPGPLPLAMAGLLIMQLVGICGAVLAATIEIVSIVGSGPIFSILGLVVAECGRRSGSRALIWLGTSALMLTLSLFGLINLAGWGPKEARDPVSLILLVYEGVIVPIGLIILWRAFVPAPIDQRSWQFDLKSMFRFMGFVAIGLAAGRIATDMGLSVLSAAAAVMLVATLAFLAWIAYHGHRLNVSGNRAVDGLRDMKPI